VGTFAHAYDQDGNELGSGLVGEDGIFRIDLNPRQIDGQEISVTLHNETTDKISLPGDVFAPDIPAPDAPTDLEVSIDGTTLTGQGAPGTIAHVYDQDGNELGTGLAGDDGKFMVNLNIPQTEGQWLEVRLEDLDTDRFSLPGDTLAPDLTVPNAPTDLLIDETGTQLTGHGQAGTTVIVKNKVTGAVIGTGTVGEDGSFDITLVCPQTHGENVAVTLTNERSHNTSAPGYVYAPGDIDDTTVNTTTDGSELLATVTALSDGGWVVTWQGPASGAYNIYQQRYSASGAKVGSETLVNTTTNGDESASSVTALSDGGWVVTWTGYTGESQNVYQQRYSASGQKVGSETRVNTTTNGNESGSSVTALSDGGWVVTWTGTPGAIFDVYQQRYSASGQKVGSETLVNTTTDGIEARSSVTALSDGGWVVTWQGNASGTQNIYQQRYSASGQKVGSETLVNTITDGDEQRSSVTALSDGGWVVTWYGNASGTNDIYQQRFDKDGNKVSLDCGCACDTVTVADVLVDQDDAALQIAMVDDDHNAAVANASHEQAPTNTSEQAAQAENHETVSGKGTIVQAGNETTDHEVVLTDNHEPVTFETGEVVDAHAAVEEQQSSEEVAASGQTGQGDEPVETAADQEELPQLADADDQLNFDNVDQLTTKGSEDGNADASTPDELAFSDDLLELLELRGPDEIDLGQFAGKTGDAEEAETVVLGGTTTDGASNNDTLAAEEPGSIYDVPSSGGPNIWIDDTDRVVA
jgi:hypothetical protein